MDVIIYNMQNTTIFKPVILTGFNTSYTIIRVGYDFDFKIKIMIFKIKITILI